MTSEESKIKHPGGRPRKTEKRNIIKGIRFTKTEYEIIQQKAKSINVGDTSYIRQMSLQEKVNSKMDEEERLFARQLIGMANNLNQLTKKAHQEGLFSLIQLFEQYKKIVEDVLKKMEKK